MSALRRRIAAAVVAVLAITLPVVSADLSAASAAESWQASNRFVIDPQQLPGTAAGAAKAFYRLRDGQGNQLGPILERAVTYPLERLVVPSVPGVYSLEAWLENANGEVLRRGTAALRFDNVPPSPPQPEAPDGWLLGTEPALLRIGHPATPLPISGIRGYAVSLDRGRGSYPCASSGLCEPAETDLTGGIDDDSLSLGTLPQGLNYARVVAVSGAGVPSPPRTVVFRVDATLPQLSLAGVPSGWSSGPVKLTARASDSLSGMTAAGLSGPFTAIAVDGDAPAVVPGDTVTAWVGGSGVHSIAFYARDAAGNVADGSPEAEAPQRTLVRIDETAPEVQFVPAQDPAEPERIEATVTDPLSGPSRSRGGIAVRLAGTRARYEHLPTQVDGDRLVAHWNSDDYPEGKYEFLATGFDVAGNAATGTGRARGGRMVLVNPLKTPVALTGELSGLRFSGRLRRESGGPLAGREVVIDETFADGAATARRTSVVRTHADGTFSLPLPTGPSREVAAYFAGTHLLCRAEAPVARLAARTQVRFGASAAKATVGGRPVVFKGRVATAGTETRAAAKLPVVLQFRYRGAPWSEFRTVETDARGRFRYAYRFSDDDSRGVRFRFRAYVKGREGWPYEPSASRPLTVTGR
jgi:hypothetical protein